MLANAFGTAPGLYFPPQPRGGGRRCADAAHFSAARAAARVEADVDESGGADAAGDDDRPSRRQLRNFKLFGLGEAQVAETLEAPLLATGIVELGYCVRPGEVILRAIGAPAALDACGAAGAIRRLATACFPNPTN